MEINNTHIADELLLFRHIKDIPHYLIFLIDLKGNILNWNEASEKITGYSEEDITGSNFSQFYTEEDKKQSGPQNALKNAIKNGFSENIGWRVKKNGERFWASEIITHLVGENSTDCLMVIIRELTKYKETEDLAQTFKYVFENSDWAFAISSTHNTFELVNPAFANLYGYSVPELIGKPIEKILDPESRAKLIENISIVNRKGHYVYESTHVRKDGSPFPVIVDATAAKDDSGKITHRLIHVRDITESKEIMESSLRKDTEFHELFEQASDGIFIADINGRYTNVNTAGCQMLGYAKEEIIGKTIMDLIPPEDIKRLEDSKQTMMKPGQIHVAEWNLKKKDGTFLPVEVSAKILPDGQWQGFVRDISERNRTREILLQSERKFRGLLEESHDIIVIVNKHATIEFVNKQFKSKFGYNPEEIMGKPLEHLLPERFKIKHVIERMKFMTHPIARPMGLGMDIYAKRKDGSEFPVDISVVPSETPSGMVFTAFVRDLSDKNRFDAQQKFLAEISTILSQNIDFDQRLFNVTNLCIPFLADFCILFISEKKRLVPKVALHREKVLEEFLNETASELFSKSEISPYIANSTAKTLEPLLIENVTDSFLQSITASDEHLKKMRQLSARSLLFVPLIAREKIIGVLSLAMSSSERRFSQEDIPFITLVGYRIGLSIDNINLYLEAQQATKAREEILSIVSHDLRNPLSAIKSGFELIPKLIDENNANRIKQLLPALNNSASFMERLIHDLLDFSKVQEGSLSLEPKEVSVKKITDDIIEPLLLKAKEKSIDLLVNIPESDSLIICDPDRIKQVLNNLIGNAIKFAPKNGKVNLTIQEQDNKFYFSVLDSGPGISNENLLHVFDRFWQEKKTAHLGTGLGLFIAKGIVEAHGGRIWVESEIDKGSNFQFEIPKKKE